MDELIYSSAKGLSRRIRDKEVSSEEVTNAYLQRIETVNSKINAVVQLQADAARAQAREADDSLARGELWGPLHGIPMTIKDCFDTVGMASTGGTKGRASFLPEKDATIVARLRAAGAILLGKTNIPELTFAYETDNLIYGRTNNPYVLTRTCGGSSGGAAAIIASGGSPLDIGSDTAGSIRLPSHFCGIAGIRPTSGRVSRTGHFPPPGGWLDALTQVGPMARFVEDLILTLPIIAGVDWRDPAIVPMALGDPYEVDLESLRVAVHTDNGILSPTPEIVDVVSSAAGILSNWGMVVKKARPANIEQAFEIFINLFSADSGGGVQMLLQHSGTTETHLLTQRFQKILSAGGVPTAELGALLIKLDLFRSAMISFLEQYDIIICPPCAFPALPHGTSWDEDKLPGFSYTIAYNLTGWPGAVVRCGTSPEGLPIGVQIVARPWREDLALAVALCLENAFGGWQHPKLLP